MSSRSIAPQPIGVQDLARLAVDSLAAKRIDAILQQAITEVAVVLFTRDARVTCAHRAEVEDIRRLGGAHLLESYETEAASLLRQRDPRLHLAAAYYAANAATPGGIGSLRLDERQTIVQLFELSLRAYRDGLSNNAPPDVAARLARLIEADREAQGERVVGVVAAQPEGVM